jgi:hypothetical protein
MDIYNQVITNFHSFVEFGEWIWLSFLPELHDTPKKNIEKAD